MFPKRFTVVKYLISLSFLIGLTGIAKADPAVYLLTPAAFQEEMNTPVVLSWQLVDPGSEVDLARVVLYKTDNNMNLVGAPVWYADITSPSVSQVLADYGGWQTCSQYAWVVILYREATYYETGEYIAAGKSYVMQKQSSFRYFSTRCEGVSEVAASAAYFDFPAEATPFVFKQRQGADIRFHYFSPYGNDKLICEIYDWKRNVLASREFDLRKGDNYITWNGIYNQLSGSESISDVLFLETRNGKDQVKTLKFSWENE